MSVWHRFAVVVFFFGILSPLSAFGDDSSSSSSIDSSTGVDSTSSSSSTSSATWSSSSASSFSSVVSSLSFSSGNVTTNTTYLVRNPNSTRAVCTENARLDALLSHYDRPPWNCPRPDVDGGILGPRNNDISPCRNFTKYLIDVLKSLNGGDPNTDLTNATMDFRPPDICPANTLASGLNLTATYQKDDQGGTYQVPSLVTKGDPYPMMVVTSNALYNMKMLFQPKVDEFTQLEIAASHGVKFFSVPNTYISVEAGGLTTGPRSRIFRTPAINSVAGGYPGQEGDSGLNNIKYNYQGVKGPDNAVHWPYSSDPNGSKFRYAVVPFWTVLINADNGVINDIHFDEGCDACADQLCSPDNNCGVTEYACAIQAGNTQSELRQPVYSISAQSDCARRRVYEYFEKTAAERAAVPDPIESCPIINSTNALTHDYSLLQMMAKDNIGGYTKNSTDCSIKVYVGWTGTDKDGKYFTSAGRRLSAFRRYSIGSAYNSASSFADNALPAAPANPDLQNSGL